MSDIPWKELIDVVRFALWIVLYIGIIGSGFLRIINITRAMIKPMNTILPSTVPVISAGFINYL